MISLLENEIVEKNHWLSNAQFTDIVAISQSTPGPIGINCATYTGYMAAINDGYPEWAAVLCAIFATISVLWLPFLLMIYVSRMLLKHGESKLIKDIFVFLRPVIIGLIAAAAILLMNADNFGSPTDYWFAFFTSVVIFTFAFIGIHLYKVHPIAMLLLCGLAGLLIY